MKKYVYSMMISLLTVLQPLPLAAQTASGCEQSELGDPPRVVYRCAGGVVLEAEAASALGIVATGTNNRPSDVEVNSNAVLIDVAPGSGPFQIRTPHAIAAVRGTEYVVDVAGDTTSVFVSRGEVIVSRPDGSDPVTLAEGFGADVSPGEPFTARQWPDERVTRLLARFAR